MVAAQRASPSQAFMAPVFVPPPPGIATTREVAFEVGTDKVYQINDPAGRRLFEGWGSLSGIDWQDEEVRPEAFQAGAEAYLQKNPVILWDHKRHIPIGKCLSLTIAPEGLFIRAEIYPPRETDSPSLPLPTDAQGRTIEGFESFRDKANEVWDAIKQGFFRGLSVNGKARRRLAWSPELSRYVPQVVEVLLYEISITPTQVHPGSKITAVNTLAKALTITKALEPIQPTRKKMDEKTRKAIEAQEAYLASLSALGEDGDSPDLPQEFIQTHEAITKSLIIEEVNEEDPPRPSAFDPELITKAVTEAMAPVTQRLDALEGSVAPPRNQTTLEAPTAASPKPTSETDNAGTIDKALDILSRTKDGVEDFGEGKINRCDAVTSMKLLLARSGARRGLRVDSLSLTPNEKAFFSRVASE